MNKRIFPILAIVAILLSIGTTALQVRQSANAARLLAGSIPEHISYQGRLTDAAGVPLNGNHNIRFCLYAAPSGGSALWCEDQTVTVATGVFSVLLGSVTPLPDTVFSDPDLYLGVQVGSDAEMTPRQQIVSVGYAYQAESAAKANQADVANEANHATTAGDADAVDGKHAADFAAAGHAHSSLDAADGQPQNALVVDSSGRVGVAAANPAAQLEVGDSGTLRLAPQTSLPSSPQAGTLFYSATDKRVFVYMGSGWVGLATSSLSSSYLDERTYTCAPGCGPCDLGTVVHHTWTTDVPSFMTQLRVRYEWSSSNCAYDYYPHNVQVLVNGTAIESFSTYQTGWVVRDQTYNVAAYLRHDGTDTVKIQLTNTGSNEEDFYRFRNVYLDFLQ